MNNTRNVRVDFLRLVGTLLVILAHVTPPKTINILRSFDVCLLVLLAGFCYKPINTYGAYCIKRLKRLCVPAWLCATVTFILCAIVCLVVRHEYVYSLRQIIETYLFLDGGIGLLWVVRIYMLMALIAPGIAKLNSFITNDFVFLSVIVSALIFNEVLYKGIYGNNYILDFVLKNYLMSAVAYGCVYGIGMRLKNNKKLALQYFIAFLLIFLLYIPYLIFKEGYHSIDFKYPPQSIYIVFGVLMSLACWLALCSVKDSSFQKSQRAVSWLSKNSFDIYLFHAIVIYVLSWGGDILNRFSIYQAWWFRYLIIVFASLTMTFVMDNIKKKCYLKRQYKKQI